ncbi:MAG: endopeptidase La [Gammaproteobacteria bacterium]|nr:endopeptidase La [Gammaproteobacteria bacterium]MBP7911814.1 endopeptidase La [Pseudomonadales bacterium]
MTDQPTTDKEAVPGVPGSTSLVLPNQALPEILYIMPVTTRPFMPAQIQPMMADATAWGDTVQRVAQTEHKVMGLFFVDTDDVASIKPADIPLVGCAVRLLNAAGDGKRVQFVAQGTGRARIKRWINRTPPYVVQVEYPKDELERNDETRAWAMALVGAIKELMPLNPLYNEDLKHYLMRFSPEDPSPLTDFAATLTSAGGRELQEVLETLPVVERMRMVLPLLKKEIEVARLQDRISTQVNETVSERQREFFLREQLKVIKQELGLSKDDRSADVERFEARLAGLTVPEHAMERIRDELDKLAILETGSPEYGVTRNYLDWATSVPWGVHSEDKLDLAHARGVLESEHDGLEDVKERILEFIAVGAYKGAISGSIILLVGPPGVGKTSIGKSIAHALGREFYRFSLGGMRDEAEIKGHRRTYIGAMPGKFVQALKQVKVANPVIMLDEIDKVGASYQGDPASALLEALDPEQNAEFLDHYLDLRVDLSKVLFVCTANQLDTIPAPLLDRMEVIRLAGYIAEEKLAIAKHHLWPRLLERAGVKPVRLRISDAALRHVIDGYAREAGVRNLEKRLASLVRKSVVKLLGNPGAKLRIGREEVEQMLGAPVFAKEKQLRGVGVVTGLAWTSMGGATLPVEATRVHSLNRGFKLTGKLGEVMKESAEIAYSYVMSHLAHYDADPKFFDESLVHLHVPEGATPKDGPSAGVTMATALLSLVRKEKLARPLAMTGELTLTGQVLPVGGIREKVIAARRVGIRELVLPEANRKDFDELPEYLREDFEVHFASRYDDVFRAVFA